MNDSNGDMQQEPCTKEELETVLTLEAREWEAQQEENSFWSTTLLSTYSSRFYRLVGPCSPSLLSQKAAEIAH